MSERLSGSELRKVLAHSPEVDSLRAIAMIAVVAMHAKIFPVGWVGVWLFYVISGYVVTLSVARTHDPRRSVEGAARFMRQRIGRIVPPYYLYIVVGLLVSAIGGVPQSATAILSLFGFYNNVAMAAGQGAMEFWPTGHLWTISVEMQFYLLFAAVTFFYPLATTKRVLWAYVVLAPFARLLTGAALLHGDEEKVAYLIYSAPGLHFDSFAIGALFALARLQAPIERMLPPISRVGAVALGFYAGAYVALNLLIRERSGIEVFRDVVSGILYGEGREVFIYTALALASLSLLALTLAKDSRVQRVTGLAPLQAIGRISYGCYIYHALALRLATLAVTGTWTGINLAGAPLRVFIFAIGLALTIGLAALSWRFVERPAAVFVRDLGRRSLRPSSPSSPTA